MGSLLADNDALKVLNFMPHSISEERDINSEIQESAEEFNSKLEESHTIRLGFQVCKCVSQVWFLYCSTTQSAKVVTATDAVGIQEEEEYQELQR